MTKKDEPEVVDPETFDELAATGEIVDVVADPEPGESEVPGNFEDSVPGTTEVADNEHNPDVVALETHSPDFYATQPPATHIGPYDESVDPEIIEANKDAYKEAAEAAAKANAEA